MTTRSLTVDVFACQRYFFQLIGSHKELRAQGDEYYVPLSIRNGEQEVPRSYDSLIVFACHNHGFF